MATKKSAGKSTAIVPWTEKFAAYAKQSTEQVKSIGGGVGISFGHGVISVGGNEIKSGKLECIILGSCAHNLWFKSKFSRDDRQPPDCYAFAITPDDPEMAPHAQATSKQATKCSECEKNVFGTADTGRGKACGNTLRIGVLLAKDVDDGAAAKSAEMATGRVSPTNLKRYKQYVTMLEEEHGRPPWAVITEVASYDDKDTQIRLEFRMVDLIEDDEILTELEKRYLKIQDVLQVPYPAPTEKKPTSAVGKSSKFAGGRGKK